MKNKYLFLLSLSLLLTSCDFTIFGKSDYTSSTSTSEKISETSTSSEQASEEMSNASSEEITQELSDTSSEQVSETSTEEISSSSSSEVSSYTPIGKVTLDFYSLNDFHGRIDKEGYYVPGISRLSTFLKQKKEANEEGYVLLNSGDLWQDTYSSQTNKGKLLTECFDAMGCEAMAIGNHEFDWGLDNIKINKNLCKNMKILGANVYDYASDKHDDTLTDSYKIIERQGVKIGIIGTIGSTQNTSITSTIWESLSFKETTPVVQYLSNYLRTEKGVNVIVWVNHADYDDSEPEYVTQIDPETGRRYVDLVFNAHSHQEEKYTYNSIPFVQGGSHGENVCHIQISYEDDKVTINDYDIESVNTNCATDPEIEAIISKYHDANYFATRDEVIGTLTGSTYTSKVGAGQMLAKATYEEYKTLMDKYNVDIIINNGSRSNIRTGKVTRENIFNMMPFTNETYIVKNIRGSEIYNEIYNYTNPYYIPNGITIENSTTKYYTVASIDYLIAHKGANRQYNYFPSFSKSNILETISDYSCDILCNYIKKKGTVSI